jgi:RNA polymerase sigma factor (sigma-70 family)
VRTQPIPLRDLSRPEPAPPDPEEGFEEFYRREYRRAVQLAWLLTHAGPNVEDLVQDAFVSVHTRYSELDNPEAYLRTAVVNRCRSWHNGLSRRRKVDARLGTEQDRARFGAPCSGPGSGQNDYLLDAVAVLPHRQRVVIVARYWGDWSELEIAEVLGCRPGTIKSLASRALARLRKEVER